MGGAKRDGIGSGRVQAWRPGALAVSGTMMLAWLSGCSGITKTDLLASGDSACETPSSVVRVEQIQLFRQAETERAAALSQQIERLQADLRAAESALVEAESDLADNHTRADAVSSLAVARIQVERAASRAPWRADAIAGARDKLIKAEQQVEESRYGAALFFVYRARRVAESLLDEAERVYDAGDARFVQANRVNLRAGPSRGDPVLSILTPGTLVFPQATEGDWILVQVSSGPAGWIHKRLVGVLNIDEGDVPSAPLP